MVSTNAVGGSALKSASDEGPFAHPPDIIWKAAASDAAASKNVGIGSKGGSDCGDLDIHQHKKRLGFKISDVLRFGDTNGEVRPSDPNFWGIAIYEQISHLVEKSKDKDCNLWLVGCKFQHGNDLMETMEVIMVKKDRTLPNFLSHDTNKQACPFNSVGIEWRRNLTADDDVKGKVFTLSKTSENFPGALATDWVKEKNSLGLISPVVDKEQDSVESIIRIIGGNLEILRLQNPIKN